MNIWLWCSFLAHEIFTLKSISSRMMVILTAFSQELGVGQNYH